MDTKKRAESEQKYEDRARGETELLIYRFDLSSITSSFTMTFHPQNFGEEKICFFKNVNIHILQCLKVTKSVSFEQMCLVILLEI